MPPRFTRDFQRTLLRIPGVAVLHFAYGAVTLCVPRSSTWFGYEVRAISLVLQHHISVPSRDGFGLPCSVFDRLYLRNLD
jgi:hypothetical protein